MIYNSFPLALLTYFDLLALSQYGCPINFVLLAFLHVHFPNSFYSFPQFVILTLIFPNCSCKTPMHYSLFFITIASMLLARDPYALTYTTILAPLSLPRSSYCPIVLIPCPFSTAHGHTVLSPQSLLHCPCSAAIALLSFPHCSYLNEFS